MTSKQGFVAANRLAGKLASDPNRSPVAPEEQSVDQLVKEAQRTHKDTTASAERALRARFLCRGEHLTRTQLAVSNSRVPPAHRRLWRSPNS